MWWLVGIIILNARAYIKLNLRKTYVSPNGNRTRNLLIAGEML